MIGWGSLNNKRKKSCFNFSIKLLYTYRFCFVFWKGGSASQGWGRRRWNNMLNFKNKINVNNILHLQTRIKPGINSYQADILLISLVHKQILKGVTCKWGKSLISEEIQKFTWIRCLPDFLTDGRMFIKKIFNF